MNEEIINQTKKPKRLWLKILIISLIIIAIIISYTGYRVWTFLQGLNNGDELEAIDKPAENETINALIIGIDELGSRSDTIILASYNPDTGKVLVMSIPRDTQVNVPGYWRSSGKPYGIQKINAAHAFRGIPLLIDTVERFLKVDIHYYARLNYSVLHKLVDAIGGVPIDIKQHMYWDDNAVDLHIHFKPGHYVLDGQKAEEFLRWRKNNDLTGDGLGDIGRVQRQQEFLKSALNQMLKLNTVLNIGEIEKIVSDGVTTNMTASFMFKMFTDVVLGFDTSNDLTFTTVPGECIGPDWVVTDEARVELDTLLQNHFAPNITETINVRVLNGTTESTLASNLAEQLNNYPNIKATAGNHTSRDIEVTEVVSYTEDTIAKYVATMVNAQYNIYRGTDEAVTDDIVIILGKDYAKK